jgi:hypothetical protein
MEEISDKNIAPTPHAPLNQTLTLCKTRASRYSIRVRLATRTKPNHRPRHGKSAAAINGE